MNGMRLGYTVDDDGLHLWCEDSQCPAQDTVLGHGVTVQSAGAAQTAHQFAHHYAPVVDPEVGSEDWIYDLIADSRDCSPGVWKTWGMQLATSPTGSPEIEDTVLVAQTYQMVDGHPRTNDLEWFRRTQPEFLLPLLEELLLLRADVREQP